MCVHAYFLPAIHQLKLTLVVIYQTIRTTDRRDWLTFTCFRFGTTIFSSSISNTVGDGHFENVFAVQIYTRIRYTHVINNLQKKSDIFSNPLSKTIIFSLESVLINKLI